MIGKMVEATMTTEYKATPRTPSRIKGLERYDILVGSLEQLLHANEPEDIGLHRIAEHAGVPRASIYHFFPTTEAAFLALARRYLAAFVALKNRPIEGRNLKSWQGLMAHDLTLTVQFYNENSPAMKLFLGRVGGMHTRRAEIEHNERIASLNYSRFNAVFDMPPLREKTRLFHICTEIVDAILAVSFIKYGSIADEYRDQALAAATGYARLFLPEYVELRSEHLEAVARDNMLALPGSALIEVPSSDRKPLTRDLRKYNGQSLR
jgi:AcrR family transcriptional regulator